MAFVFLPVTIWSVFLAAVALLSALLILYLRWVKVYDKDLDERRKAWCEVKVKSIEVSNKSNPELKTMLFEKNEAGLKSFRFSSATRPDLSKVRKVRLAYARHSKEILEVIRLHEKLPAN